MVHLETLSMRLLFDNRSAQNRQIILGVQGVLYLLFAGVTCAWSQGPTTYTIGQLFDVKTQHLISPEELKPKLVEADVIYIGEEHYTPSHIQAALQIMDTLLTEGRKPVLAMEMFAWDGQPALDHFVSGQIPTEEQFLQEVGWEKNWGGEFKDYKPLVTFSKQHSLSLYALNPPRNLVRLVASQGLAQALKDPSMDQWNIDKHMSVDDPEYRSVIFEQITACHPGLPDKAYQRIYEASIFRDEGMAKIIKEYLQNKAPGVGPLISYTGGGHIQYRLPVPNRVQKGQSAGFSSLSIYLIALDSSRTEEIDQAIHEGIADYVWLKELGPRGPQPRCG